MWHASRMEVCCFPCFWGGVALQLNTVTKEQKDALLNLFLARIDP